MYWCGIDDPLQIRFSNKNNIFNKDIIFQNPDELARHMRNDAINIKINPNVKVAVITQTYYRKNNSSKKNLQNMFKMLEAQTYKNFKVFITGDNYQPNEEFEELHNKYNGEIYAYNINHSCRELNLGSIENYWACGGFMAAKNSYEKAQTEGYDIVLMLDDDDYWYDFYIKNVVSNFLMYPNTGFMVTKAEYCDQGTLPRTVETNIFYNNYIPEIADSVRSSTAHNIHIIGKSQIEVWERLIKQVKELHMATNKDYRILPGDAAILEVIGKNVKEGKYESLYIPIISVRKDSDANWENINTS